MDYSSENNFMVFEKKSNSIKPVSKTLLFEIIIAQHGKLIFPIALNFNNLKFLH